MQELAKGGRRKEKEQTSLALFFVFPMKVSEEFAPSSFYKCCVHMYVNRRKSERRSSLEYYHMIYIGKTKHTG